MLMTSVLTPSQCATMREFFALLLKIKALDVTHVGVKVGIALDLWNREQFGMHKVTLTGCTTDAMRKSSLASRGKLTEQRRQWVRENPDAHYTDAAKAWGVQDMAAKQWM